MVHQLPALVDDTVINVAQLLKQPVGAARVLDLGLHRLRLDEDLSARDVSGSVRLTRISTGILAEGRIEGLAELACVRCLTEFDQPFETEFDGEYQPSIDVRTGEPLPPPTDEEVFVIDNNHQLDLAELLRQVAIVALPMRPVCGDFCPGFEPEFPAGEELEDERLAVLRRLLDDGTE